MGKISFRKTQEDQLKQTVGIFHVLQQKYHEDGDCLVNLLMFVDVIVKYSEHPADFRKMPQLQTLVSCSKMDSAFAPRLQLRLLRSSAGKTGGGCPWCGMRCCLMYSAAMPSLFILYTSLHWLVENGVEGVSS
jgi:hypothetical protein